jgi:hypothetical protein
MHRFNVSLQTKVAVRALGKRAMSVRAPAMMIPATRRLMPGVPSSRLMLSSSLRGTVSIRGSNSASHRHREQPDAAAHRARRGGEGPLHDPQPMAAGGTAPLLRALPSAHVAVSLAPRSLPTDDRRLRAEVCFTRLWKRRATPSLPRRQTTWR